jgi:S1-C subfamily serine protease
LRIFTLLGFLSLPTFLENLEASMVSSNILQRVFTLKMGSEQGTGFTIEVDGRQYLITAKHILAASPSSTVIEIFHDKNWVKVPFQSIIVEPVDVDIAVLALPQQLSGVLPIQLGIKSSFLSQDVYFVGFPFGLSIDGHTLNSGFPIPLVKHGIIAAFGNGRGEPFLVDGINNPGFSGGPVIRSEVPTNPTIIGIVSAYRAAQEPVYKQNVKTQELSVLANTGLLVAFDIDYAVEAIKKNPIGFRVQPAP